MGRGRGRVGRRRTRGSARRGRTARTGVAIRNGISVRGGIVSTRNKGGAAWGTGVLTDGFVGQTVANILFITVLIKYVLCASFDFNVLFVVVDTLAVCRFKRLMGVHTSKMGMGGAVVVLKKTCLFLTMVNFYVSTTSSGVFVPCMLLLLCLVVDRLCLGGRGPILG